MPIPTDVKALTELFRDLGAPDPEIWAKSQAEEGINQLHRFLFLRQAWQCVVSEQDDAWIDANLMGAKENPNQPFAGVGHALARILAAGISREVAVDLVRGMQGQLLFDLCYLLGDPSLEEPSVRELGWALVQTNETNEPTQSTIGGLHESLLGTDPTGREMRPRTES